MQTEPSASVWGRRKSMPPPFSQVPLKSGLPSGRRGIASAAATAPLTSNAATANRGDRIMSAPSRRRLGAGDLVELHEATVLELQVQHVAEVGRAVACRVSVDFH